MSIAVKAGDLRQRVLIKQKNTETPNAYGERQTTWRTLASVWAKVAPISAREAERGKSFGETVSHQVEMRYRDDVTTGMKISHRSRDLYINGSIDDGELRTRLILFCSEVPSGQ